MAERIKTAKIFREGSGWIMYFVLADKADKEIAVKGKAEYRVIMMNKGFVFTQYVIAKEDLEPTDYVQASVGQGFFAHPMLIHRFYIEHEKFRHLTSRSGQAEEFDWELRHWEGSLILQITFTDELGRKLVAQEQFWL